MTGFVSGLPDDRPQPGADPRGVELLQLIRNRAWLNARELEPLQRRRFDGESWIDPRPVDIAEKEFFDAAVALAELIMADKSLCALVTAQTRARGRAPAMTGPREISQAELDDLKARNPCDQVAAKWVRLRKGQKGRMVGPCPICSENSQSAKATKFEAWADGWVCAGCADGGDVIKLVQLVQHLEFLPAVDWLGGVQQLDPAQEAEREAQHARKRAAAERTNAEFRELERAKVFEIWKRGTKTIAGTPVEAYLALRGIEQPAFMRVRCIADMPYYVTGARDAEVIHRGPAMLVPIMRGGKFSALHITYIDLEARKGKAVIKDPESGEQLPAKKVRGSKAGAHIEIVPREAPRRLVIGEGIEKTIAMWRALDHLRRDLSETAFWTSIDLGNLGGKSAETWPHPTLTTAGGRPQRVPGPDPDLELPAIEIPDNVEEIIILGDNTSDSFLTRCAIARGAARWARPTRAIRVAWCWVDADFDDVLCTAPLDEACRRIAEAFDAAQPVERPANVLRLEQPRKSKTGPASKAERKSAPKSPSRSEGGEGPPPAEAWGYDVDALNREYALVLMGSKSVVFHERPEAMIEDQKRMLLIEAFGNWFANRFTQIVGTDGKVKTITWARRWMSDRRRRQYRGIEFHPDPENAPGTPGYLNLWSGFAVQPARERDARRYKTFRDHLLNNVCSGNREHFDWVFGFFAHMAQRPRERLGTALVMRGRMGTGKTKVGEVFGRLWPRHYFLVDDPRYVTGQFNAHMATCLLLQADEAVWAGDKAAEGRLKGLITSPIQQIEAKGVDPIRLPNYVRLIMTSNEDWVVPAGKDERRFAVLDVDPRCAQKHEYFREMDAELDDGGLEALLADLLAFDLESVNLWQIPRTDALLEQKIRSLNSVESWWFERLASGATTRHASQWNEEVACATLFGDYIATADKIGVRRKQEETVFGITIGKLVPGLARVRRTVQVEDDRGGGPVTKRAWCYQLPPLADAREAFDRIVGQSVAWPRMDDARENNSADEPVF